MQFNNKMYDILKHIVQLVLPATGTLYFALSQIWGLPFGEEVVGTIVAITTFLGVSLKISNTNYLNDESRFDGIFRLENDGEVDRWIMDLKVENPEELLQQKVVTFQVQE